MLVFVVLFLFNSKPAFQCQFNPEVTSFLPTIYGITPTYARLAQKADLTRYYLFTMFLIDYLINVSLRAVVMSFLNKYLLYYVEIADSVVQNS